MSLTTVETAPIGVLPTAAGPGEAIEGRSPLRLAWGRLRTDRVAMIATGMIVFMAVLAIVAPLIATLTGHGATTANLDTGTDSSGQPLAPGTGGYLLGT